MLLQVKMEIVLFLLLNVNLLLSIYDTSNKLIL